MYDNIKALTGLNISLDDSIRQRLFSSPQTTSTKMIFLRAEELFVKEYKNFNDRVLAEKDFMSKNLKQK